jgi:glucosaminylphosphatidylinositol acyltransferase
VSVYRGTLLLGTSIAILAVDFRAFPRRFAKVEAFGTGEMHALDRFWFAR